LSVCKTLFIYDNNAKTEFHSANVLLKEDKLMSLASWSFRLCGEFTCLCGLIVLLMLSARRVTSGLCFSS